MSSKVSRTDWLVIVASLIGVWFIDLFTKALAVANVTELYWVMNSPFGLVMHRNPGAILGAFADLPPVLRVVSLSTGGAFLVFIYAVVQYLLPGRIYKLRLGMSLLLGGILGNVTDRILAGSVVDFLVLRAGPYNSPAFNFADAIQWVGYGMIVWSLIKEGHQLWPSVDDRKKLWILPKFQLKYTFVLMFIGFSFTLIAGVFSYTYIRVMITDLVGPSPQEHDRFLVPFLYILSIISVGFMLLLLVIGRILSHRTAGPLYAFELFLEDLLNGKDRALKLRAGDELRHLEELADRLRVKLKSNFVGASAYPPPEKKQAK